MVATLALAGCFQPLYGPLSAGGSDTAGELQAIAIEPIPDRVGHYLGDDLVFALNGTGSHVPPKYRLFVTLRETSTTPLIDTVSGIASAATVNLNADYRLVPVAGGEPITKGTALCHRQLRPQRSAFRQHPRRARRRDPRRQAAVRSASHPPCRRVGGA